VKSTGIYTGDHLHKLLAETEGSFIGDSAKDDYNRPVLKHGPRSVTHEQVIGWKNPIA